MYVHEFNRKDPRIKACLREWPDHELEGNPEIVNLSGIVGFCGCGDPGGVARFLLKILRAIAVRSDHKVGTPERDEAWRQLDQVLDELPGGRSGHVATLLLYWIDDRGWVEHGSSVGGSWIEPRGLAAIGALELIIERDEAEDALAKG